MIDARPLRSPAPALALLVLGAPTALAAPPSNDAALRAVHVDRPAPEGAKGHETKRLEPRAMRASSFLKNGWNAAEENYLPPYAADDDDKTAWVEGADGDGGGEWLEWVGPRLEKPRRYVVFVRNGYQKSKALHAANGRARSVLLQPLLDGKATGPLRTVLFDDAMGWQRFEIAASGPTSSLRFTLADVAAGSKYRDTCISDIAVFVEADDKYVGAAEALAREEIRRFTAERAAAAKELARSRRGALPRLVLASTAPAVEGATRVLDVPASVPAADGWRRVGAELPPGARAQADALAQGMARHEELALAYPFLERARLTLFDAPSPTAALKRKLEQAQSALDRERKRFLPACEKERREHREDQLPAGYSCEDEFEESCCVPTSPVDQIRFEIEAAQKSGVFVRPKAALAAPEELLLVDARWLGDRETYLRTTRCLLVYGAAQAMSATCIVEGDGAGAGDDATSKVALRALVDSAGKLVGVAEGEPGQAPTAWWVPAPIVAGVP